MRLLLRRIELLRVPALGSLGRLCSLADAWCSARLLLIGVAVLLVAAGVYLFGWGGHPSIGFGVANVDLGVIGTNESVRMHTFRFGNRGRKELRLTYLGSTCGCTKIERYTELVPPRAAGEIVLRVEPDHALPGDKTQRVAFATNDPENPHLAVNVVWRSGKREDVRISPLTMRLDVSRADLAADSPDVMPPILIVDAERGRLKVSDIQTSAHLEASIQELMHKCPTCEGDARTHLFRITPKIRPDIPDGELLEWVRFSTNHPEYSSVTIPVTGTLHTGLVATPKLVMFQTPHDLGTKRVHIAVPSDMGVDAEVDVVPLAPWLTASLLKQQPRAIDIAVSVDSEKLPGGNTGDPLRSAVDVRIRGQVQQSVSVKAVVIGR